MKINILWFYHYMIYFEACKNFNYASFNIIKPIKVCKWPIKCAFFKIFGFVNSVSFSKQVEANHLARNIKKPRSILDIKYVLHKLF